MLSVRRPGEVVAWTKLRRRNHKQYNKNDAHFIAAAVYDVFMTVNAPNHDKFMTVLR
jgi:hypothetical protein